MAPASRAGLDHVPDRSLAHALAEVVLVHAVPGAAARPARDRPGRGRVSDQPGSPSNRSLSSSEVDLGETTEELGETYVILRRHVHPGRQSAPVELVEVAGRLSAALLCKLEAIPFAPRVRAQRQAALARQPCREAARAQNVRLLQLGLTPLREAQRIVTDGAHEGLGQAGRVEALADRARVARIVLDDRSTERLEPLDRIVELLDDQAL